MVSWLGRLNYNYDNRYYAGFSFRRDGSSRLSKDNRWGNFWSVSAAWRFGSEKFMEPIKQVVSDGKVRASYGVMVRYQVVLWLPKLVQIWSIL